MAYIYALSDTWNAAGTTFTGIGLNVTDTASAAGSLLLDLRVGGTSLFNVAKNGRLATDNITSAGAYYLTLPNSISTAGYWASATDGALGSNGAGFVLAANREFAWSGTASNPNVAVDLRLARDAANTLAQRNGTNAQAFRVYNTFTDASNYERGFIRYSSNQLEIGHEAAGTGSGDRLIVIRRPNAGTILDVVGASTISARIGAVSGFATAMGVGPNGASPDIFLFRRAAGVGAITGNAGGTTGAALEFLEQTAPAAPSANNVRIYAEDNGSGKTRLMALFATGAAVQIAIEP
jgi:hypothetical protein